MAGNAHRGRSAGHSDRPVLVTPDGPMGPELPNSRPDGKEWCEQTVNWYNSIRESAIAPIMGMMADWYSLMDLALLKDDFWRMPKKSAVMAAEIRQREESFGITPGARIRLKLVERTADDMSASVSGGGSRGGQVERSVRSRRAMLRVVPGGA